MTEAPALVSLEQASRCVTFFVGDADSEIEYCDEFDGLLSADELRYWYSGKLSLPARIDSLRSSIADALAPLYGDKLFVVSSRKFS